MAKKVKVDKDAAAERVKKIFPLLKKEYPNAKCALDHTNPLELLVATIMSAQCTDVRVNIVTKDLFKKYRSAADFANADEKELQEDIRTTGFFRNKSKNIIAGSHQHPVGFRYALPCKIKITGRPQLIFTRCRTIIVNPYRNVFRLQPVGPCCPPLLKQMKIFVVCHHMHSIHTIQRHNYWGQTLLAY